MDYWSCHIFSLNSGVKNTDPPSHTNSTFEMDFLLSVYPFYEKELLMDTLTRKTVF